MPQILEEFLAIVRHDPVKSLQIAYWYLTRRRVRAAGRFNEAICRTPQAYRHWIRSRERQSESVAAAPEKIAQFIKKPRFSILLLEADTVSQAQRRTAVQSVLDQCYPQWELVLAGDVTELLTEQQRGDPRIRIVAPQPSPQSGLSHALKEASGDFVIPLTGDCLLAPTALLQFADALQTPNDIAAVFGDHDHLDLAGQRNTPWFKPEWNPELFFAQDYLSPACAIRIDLARKAAETVADDFDCVIYPLLLASLNEGPALVIRAPGISAHLQPGVIRNNAKARLRAVSSYLEPRGAHAEPGPFESVVVRWPLPETEPGITIVIPTRDKVDLLRACVNSVIEKTKYRNYKIIIVDNLSSELETQQYFDEISTDIRIEIMEYPHEYNYSAINNYAVNKIDSDYICLLNNDTEIVDGIWLQELLRYAARPGVGAVGAKLLYEDRSIQHAGVVLGLGGAAGHAHRGLPNDEIGYFAQAHLPHYASAVTAACLLVERRKYLEVGGLDEDGFKIAYNDVDLCVKLGAKGWRNVYAPQAVAIHYESKSRGQDFAPENLARYKRELALLQTRWKTRSFQDPMHHPFLDNADEEYRPRFTSKLALDWIQEKTHMKGST